MSKDVEPDCVRSGIWTYINIDIFNKYGYGIFGCGYGITPEEKKTPEGFKTYIHKFPGGFVYLNKIKYNKSEQNGFENIKSCHTDVTVYYWSHDEDNLLPLAIRVTKTGWYWAHYYYHEYYKRDSIDSNNWTKHKDKNFYSGASDISNTFKNVVVLKLDAKNNETYGVNGEKTSTINPDVKITVSVQNNYKPGYDKYTHHLLNNESMRVVSTKLGDSYKPFKESILKKEYRGVSVYYSNKDGEHKKPLILHLGTGEETYYRLDGGEKWVYDSQITSSNLEIHLANLSGAYIIDISNTGQYPCSPGCGTQIQVASSQVDTHNYSKRRHYINGNTPFSVSSFVGANGESQTGLSSPTNINEVNVFFYPKDSGSPFLICYSSGSALSWFKKAGKDTWEEVTESTIKPNHADDHTRIEKLLIWSSSPEVTIKIEWISGSSYGSDSENINIRSEKVSEANGYSKITHRITDKTFIMKGITHVNKSQTVKGSATFPTYPIDNIAVFYSSSDSKCSKPLLIELKLQGDTTYKYYEKTGKANEWNLFRSGETTQLTGDPLKKKLDELYAIHFPSNLPIILWSTFGTGLSGTAVGLGIWKWPDIMSSLITRL